MIVVRAKIWTKCLNTSKPQFQSLPLKGTVFGNRANKEVTLNGIIQVGAQAHSIIVLVDRDTRDPPIRMPLYFLLMPSKRSCEYTGR